MGANFPRCAASGVFDAKYHPSLEGVAFLDQLVNTSESTLFALGQGLQIS